MIVVSHILRFDGSNASYIHKRDAKKRAKSNVLQTKSTAAGALRVQLGHGENGDEIVGDAIRDIKFTTIKHMNTLMYMTAFASLVICAAVRVGICIVPWGMLDRIF
jgi:cobalamin biosynthesis protein CobD/CbiB